MAQLSNAGTDGAAGRLQVLQKVADLQEAISEGATSFLLTEFKYMGVFMVSLSPRQHVFLLGVLPRLRTGLCVRPVLHVRLALRCESPLNFGGRMSMIRFSAAGTNT